MRGKRNAEFKFKKSGDNSLLLNSSRNRKVDTAFFESEMSRRELLRLATVASAMFAFPWAGSAFAAVPPPPQIPFTPNKTRDGIVGPYGEVRITIGGSEALPAIVEAAGGLALMDMTARSPFVRFGAATDSTAITLTSEGVAFGKTKPLPWNKDAIVKMVTALANDRKKARGAMLLRSALHTSYPVAVAQLKARVGKGMATALAKGTAGYKAGVMKCTTTTITDTVVTEVLGCINKVVTALEQWQKCYDEEVAKDPCKSSIVGPAICAAATCTAKGFVDIVTCFTGVVDTIVTEVVRTVVTCVLPKPGFWPHPWDLLDLPIPKAVPQPKAQFGQKEIDAGLKLLKDIQTQIGGFLGPFQCLLDGKWSLAQLDTQLNLGGGNIVIPYGVKVCISSACATSLIDGSMVGKALAAWGGMLGVLAALSTDIAALGIPANAAAATLVAALGGAATAGVAVSPGVAVAALILAFLLLMVIYATAIVAQLPIHQLLGNFADGEVCIEHPTFAIALISIATLGIVSIQQLIPPIVTG